MPQIRYIKIQFKNAIHEWELPAFRGAVIEKTKRQSVLFHNHTETGFRYAYSLIQYKVNGKKPCIVCINDGTDDIHYLLSLRKLDLSIGERSEIFKIEDIHIKYHNVSFLHESKSFSIRNWNAFNDENYKIYLNIKATGKDPAPMLKRILTGNIISFAKGIKWDVNQEIKIDHLKIIDEKYIPYKGTNLLALNVEFTCNVSLPSWIGLGKGTALGFGTIKSQKQKAMHPIVDRASV